VQIVCESEVNNYIIIVCNICDCYMCFFLLCGKQMMMMMMMMMY